MRQNFRSFLVFAVALLALFGGVKRGPAQEVAPVPKLLIYTPPVIPVWQPPARTSEPLPATTTAGIARTHDGGFPNRRGHIQADIAVDSQKSMTVRDLHLCVAATKYTWKSDETPACPSNNLLDCGNGWCCPETYTMHCPDSTCDDITDGKDGCYNPDRLTDELVEAAAGPLRPAAGPPWGPPGVAEWST